MRWTLNLVASTKAEIKDELSRFSVGKERLAAALAQYQSLQAKIDTDNNLACLVYGMSALIQHLRHQLLSNAQVERIKEGIESILLLQQISPETSKLAFLHQELHSALSQIYRNEGNTDKSLWSQETANWLAPSDENFRILFGLATRYLRIGRPTDSNDYLERALQASKNATDKMTASIVQVKLKRLTGSFADASRLVEDGVFANANESILLEQEWERQCIHASTTRNLSRLFKLTKRSHTHYSGIYCAESKLWSMADQNPKSLQKTSKMATLKADRSLNLGQLGPLTKLATTLEICHDDTYPIETRVSKLGRALEMRSNLRSVDHELLVLAAAARWTHSNKLTCINRIALGHYQNLSLLLSSGKTIDTLNILSDLVENKSQQVA